MLKGFHKSMGGTAMSTHWGDVIFKTWKSVRAGCFHLAMMECEGIRGETSFADAVQLQCLRKGKVFASAGRWISKRSTTSLSAIFENVALRYRAISWLVCLSCPCVCPVGTSVMQVTATDADDPTYGNSARLVYSILQGQPYFSVEPQTGELVSTDIYNTTKASLKLWYTVTPRHQNMKKPNELMLKMSLSMHILGQDIHKLTK